MYRKRVTHHLQLEPQKICPYCIRDIVVESKDHIFSDFLGGRRTILACEDCNNRFGSDFEGKAATETLHKLHLSIASWGLPLKANLRSWKRAFKFRGISFDLIMKDGEIRPRLSKPIVQKGVSGRTISILYGDRIAAEKAVANAQRKGKAAPNSIVEKLSVEISPFHIPFVFTLDENLMRLAVKMCIALSTDLPDFDFVEILLGRFVLDGTDSPSRFVRVAYEDYLSLNALRSPLSHVVYVERFNGNVVGVVQFFGVIQLYCVLGRSDKKSANAALVGTLDPITNQEKFEAVNPVLGLRKQSDVLISGIANLEGMDKWLRNFEKSAVARGATRQVNLVGKLEFGDEKLGTAIAKDRWGD